MPTQWSDVSQYQGIPVDDSYPHSVFCFRTNSGDRVDSLAIENGRRALDMLRRGELEAVVAYYFFRPGQANCDLHRQLLQESGLWGDARLVTMIDVESAGGEIRGNQSAEVNDEAERLAGWYGNPKRVIGYWNPIADPDLWPARPPWMRLVVPSYERTPGQPSRKPPGYFAHQYTDSGRCLPWPAGVDLNYTDLDLPELLASWGITGGNTVADPITVAAGQLHPFPKKIRQIVNPDNVNTSTRSPKEPWPYDISADVWNETVWDGFKLPGTEDDPDADKRSLVGWVLDSAVQLRELKEQHAEIIGQQARIIELLEGGAK